MSSFRDSARIVIALALAALAVPGCAREPPASRAPVEPAAWLAPTWGARQTGIATYYASSLAGRPTATGEPYDPRLMTAAHRTLPLGTWVVVRRADGRSVVVRVNDRGPYVSGRILDLSRRAAEQLGMIEQGKIWVEVLVLGKPQR